jgi:hypothetical protein
MISKTEQIRALNDALRQNVREGTAVPLSTSSLNRIFPARCQARRPRCRAPG